MADEHPLNSNWCLWHIPNITSQLSQQYGSWELANLALTKNVVTFTSVEMFWAIFQALPSATKLSKEENLMFFRAGVEPKWEDPSFKAKPGGRFMCKFDPVPAADKFIQTLLVLAISEQLSVDTNTANLIGGIRYVKKDKVRDSFIRFEVWITDAEKAEDMKRVLQEVADDCDINNLFVPADNCVFKSF